MKVTERKIQANRMNALKSTGPKSPDGKSRSRWNALKHGLLAKAVIIDQGESKERREDLEALFRALEEALAPEGKLEQVLVEKMAVDYWRLRRFLMSETGRLRSQVDALEADERRRLRTEGLLMPSWVPGSEPNPESLSLGIDRCSYALNVVRQGLAGKIDASEARRKAVDILGWDGFDNGDEDGDDSDEAVDSRAESGRSAKNARSLEGLREQREQIKWLLAFLEMRLAADEERFRLRLDARRLELQAPPLDRLDLRMRYETMLERQLQRDLELLANVQRMRVLGPVGYRPVRALAAEEARSPSENGAEAAT